MPKVTMPQLGESVAEGTIGRWLKQVGDHVDKYEPIVEVVTDKVNAEVPSPFEGTLSAILVQEGETVANNTEIAVIDGAGDAPAAAAASTAASATAADPAPVAVAPAAEASPATVPVAPAAMAPSPATTGGNGAASHGPAGSDERSPAADYEGRVTPAVRRLAREHELDLSQVPGTGHAGRVTREDVLAYIERQRTGAAQPATTPTPAAPTASGVSPAGTAPPAPAAPRWRRRPRPPPPTPSSRRPRCARPSPPR